MPFIRELSIASMILLAACQPASKKPPPAAQLIGGPCEYDETPALAIVSDVDAEQVRFLIGSDVIPYSRQDLPAEYTYASGDQFNVIEKHIVQGTCTPYILEIVSSAATSTMPPSAPASQTTKWRDPSLK